MPAGRAAICLAAAALAGAAPAPSTTRDAVASRPTQVETARDLAGARAHAAARLRAGGQLTPAASVSRLSGPRMRLKAGRFITPVTGPVLRSFGTPAEGGPATGVTFAAASGTPVVSPCAGRVAFAAPFRSYGRLVIVACGGGGDVVLAGLGRLYAAPGRAVRPGETLGRMPGGPARPSLYVELRVGAQAVDPLPFLRAKL